MDNFVADARKALGITQEQLAQKCGVTRQTVIAIEKGNYNPSLELAFALVRALGKKQVEELFSSK